MRYIGHERERDIFSKALKANRFVHAYIFSGKESSGKKLLAREIARSLFSSCGLLEESGSRHSAQVDAGNHPDLHMFEDDALPIEKVRGMAETAYMSPHSANYKVFIIDNAHNMQTASANAFLKTLEEPGENTVFFLITDKYDRLLPTIRSRCVHIEFSRLTDDEVSKIVRQHRPEAVSINAAVKLAAGSVSQALYFLDHNAEYLQNIMADISCEKLYKNIEALKEKDDIRIFCSVLYSLVLEKYKKNGKTELADLGNYLLDILQRLNYNVNLEIFRFDLFIKINEAMIGRN